MESEESSMRFIKTTSKPCPRCKVPTHKSEGCNHMRCSRCQEEWCWLCGRGITPGGAYPAHYKWWNPLGCGGAQFTARRDRNCTWFLQKLLQFFLLPLMLVASVVSCTSSLRISPPSISSWQFPALFCRSFSVADHVLDMGPLLVLQLPRAL